MKQTHYVAREPDAQGFIDYPQQEHAVWNTLITRQLKVIEGRACQEYLDGIEQLGCPMTASRNWAKSTRCSAPPPAGRSPACRR
jgi:phenylalanine-4-hydroxylase